MPYQISAGRLLRAGFRLTDCDDGKYWVLECRPGPEADRMAAVCGRFVDDMENTAVKENIVLQCDENFKDPLLYMDGFLWQLDRIHFSGMIARLTKLKASG